MLPEVVMSGDVPTLTSSDVPDADTPHRLVQSLRMQFLRGGGDAVVQLSPEHLGPVTISLKVEQGAVEARITASNPVVAEWLQAHHESLREGLQANGLTLDRLQVDKDGQAPDRRERRETPQRQRFRQPAETQSTFELTI
jgi:flagellar hook-length control protein FliK